MFLLIPPNTGQSTPEAVLVFIIIGYIFDNSISFWVQEYQRLVLTNCRELLASFLNTRVGDLKEVVCRIAIINQFLEHFKLGL